MLKTIFFTLFLLALPLSARVLISPVDVMKSSFGEDSIITKKNILLSKSRTKKIEKHAQTKIKSKIFRIYKAHKDGVLLGYGILVNKKVRTKNAVMLYLISNQSVLKSMEVVAFNEPLEYLPSKSWNAQFNNTPTDSMLSSKTIPTITGATLSASSLTNASRVAFALYNEMLKGKE